MKAYIGNEKFFVIAAPIGLTGVFRCYFFHYQRFFANSTLHFLFFIIWDRISMAFLKKIYFGLGLANVNLAIQILSDK